MQELLHRNSSPHKFRNASQAFRLTQGFVLSSTQQLLDKAAAHAQENVNSARKMAAGGDDGGVALPDSVTQAEGLIRDAENAKHLLSALHDTTGARATEVDLRLKQVAHDLAAFVAAHVQQSAEAMMACLERQCPTVMAANDGRTRLELRAAAAKRSSFSPDFITALIMDQLGLEVHNKINEVNLSIANLMSDRVIDDVVEGLSASSKAIVAEVGRVRKKRSLTPDLLRGSNSNSSSRSVSVSDSLEQQHTNSPFDTSSTGAGDAVSQKSEQSPLGTPQTSKRKSAHGRKLRPKSAATNADARDRDDEDEEEAAEPVGFEDTVSDLPSTNLLRHLGKARPRRAKSHAPSRGAVASPANVSVDDADSSIDHDDSSVSKFFSPSSANTSLSQESTPLGSPAPAESRLSKTSHQSSREDVSTATASPVPAAVDAAEVSSPVPAQRDVKRMASGLSCLLSKTTDEDASALAKPSPEKRAMSPSIQSLSDIISPVAKGSPRAAANLAEGKVLSPAGIISPFAARKTDSDSRADPDEDVEGKRTPEEVVKRHGVGHGGNPDLLAEMREKRASMVPKVGAEGELSPPARALPATPGSNAAAADEAKNLFGRVKLR
jgi:hypothetical protein